MCVLCNTWTRLVKFLLWPRWPRLGQSHLTSEAKMDWTRWGLGWEIIKEYQSPDTKAGNGDPPLFSLFPWKYYTVAISQLQFDSTFPYHRYFLPNCRIVLSFLGGVFLKKSWGAGRVTQELLDLQVFFLFERHVFKDRSWIPFSYWCLWNNGH